MRFKMLGPVEVVDEGKAIVLGGAKQRATLAYLLMYPNRVVATSRLLQVLWTDRNTPKSARKILQNAIWGLRSLLTFDGASGSAVTLETQAPGYVLRVDPDEIDMHRFLRLAKEGRAELINGSAQVAARLLRDALVLWDGPALGDLVEAGTSWPEVTALQNARLDSLEDFFDAELACGGHHAVLDELELMVKNEPTRERACGQLMLALYRSGRQVDALRVYSRVRSALVSGLGLEPGKELHELQCAILNQDPALTPPFPRQGTGLTGLFVPQEQRQVSETDHRSRQQRTAAPAGQIGVVMIRTRLAAPPGGDDAVPDNDRLKILAETTRTKVEQFGGTLTASIGSVSLALFNRPGAADNALLAVRATMAIRDALLASPHPAQQAPIFHAAVATGNAAWPASLAGVGEGVTPVGWAAVTTCETLLPRVPDGEIMACDITRDQTLSSVTYRRVVDPSFSAWQVQRASPDTAGARTGSDRSCELDLLRGLLTWVRNHTTPHLVTVVGEPDSGKSRLLTDFERLASNLKPSQLVVDRLSAATGRCATALLRRLLHVLCAIQHDEPASAASAKLAAAIGRIATSQAESDWLTADLRTLLDIDETQAEASPDTMPAWRRFLDRVTPTEPLVVLVDDLDHDDDALVDLLDDLTHGRRPLPLLLVVATRPGLLARHPQWGMGMHYATQITLDTRCGMDTSGVPDEIDVSGWRGDTPVRSLLRPVVASTL